MTAVRKLTAIVCSLAATSLFAQTTGTTAKAQITIAPASTTAVEQTTAETDRDADDPRALRLSLDEAIRTSMERNLGIQISRYDYRAAGESLRSEYGLYDWLGTAHLERDTTESPQITTFESSATRSSAFNFGVEQFIPTGGTYNVGMTNSRVTTQGESTLVSPAYRSGLSLAFAQPLLRNFGIDVNQRGINIARNTLGINNEAFRVVLLDTANSVEQAYLNLVYSRQFVDVVKEALFLARDQSRITQIRIDVGASAPLDILQPRVQIATEEESLINAVAQVRRAEDDLRELMHLDQSEWDRPIIPTDPVRYTPVPVGNVAEAVNKAFELRPELRELALTTDIRRIQHMFARNQTRPQLDLRLNYNSDGLAGRSAEIDPITGQPTGNFSSTSIGRAFGQAFGGEFPAWTVALNVGVPITNIGARAEAKRAELELERARTDVEFRKQLIAVEVRTTARAIDTSAKNIAASRTAREAAEQNLEAERRRYENGMTTNFQVLEVQQQLSDARARELQSLVAYNKAIALYHRAVGDLLEYRNIQIQPEKVEEPRMPGLFSRMQRYDWLYYDKKANAETTASPSTK